MLAAVVAGYALRRMVVVVPPSSNRFNDELAQLPEIRLSAEPVSIGRFPTKEVVQGWDEERQIAWSDTLPRADAVSEAEVEALFGLLECVDLHPVVRNNVANFMLTCDKALELMPARLCAMYANPKEDSVWRDYCVQFLGSAIEALAADERTDVAAELRSIGRNDHGSIGATALVQEGRLVQEGVLVAASDWSTALASRVSDPASPGIVRQTVYALIGQHGCREHLPLLRQELVRPLDDDAKRGALYALGVLGNPEDLTIIRPYVDDANPAVAAVAAAALQRLDQSMSDHKP